MRKSKGVDDALRMQIIEEHLHGASKYGLSRKYNLDGAGRITSWMRKFGIETKEEEVMALPGKKAHTESEELKALRLELKQVKKALAEEKLRSLAYDKLIDVAESQFNIAIRKKAGAKQSER
jgi:hypothetical protein